DRVGGSRVRRRRLPHLPAGAGGAGRAGRRRRLLRPGAGAGRAVRCRGGADARDGGHCLRRAAGDAGPPGAGRRPQPLAGAVPQGDDDGDSGGRAPLLHREAARRHRRRRPGPDRAGARARPAAALRPGHDGDDPLPMAERAVGRRPARAADAGDRPDGQPRPCRLARVQGRPGRVLHRRGRAAARHRRLPAPRHHRPLRPGRQRLGGGGRRHPGADRADPRPLWRNDRGGGQRPHVGPPQLGGGTDLRPDPLLLRHPAHPAAGAGDPRQRRDGCDPRRHHLVRHGRAGRCGAAGPEPGGRARAVAADGAAGAQSRPPADPGRGAPLGRRAGGEERADPDVRARHPRPGRDPCRRALRCGGRSARGTRGV
ncbi:MAG: hypothetical protein AVDCRST_MAG59-777, partial [uncultured Thermomicrobiales bacterium]